MFSIIVPAHNEERRIEGTLIELLAFLNSWYNKKNYEIIVVDDSNDRTPNIVRKYMKKDKHLKMMHFAKRRGKGAALNLGIMEAKGDQIITFDADAATPPWEIPNMLKKLKKYDIVIGSRKQIGSKNFGVLPLKRKFASRSFGVIVNAMFRLGIRDTQCGFKGMNKKVAKKVIPKVKSKGFEWDVEFLVRAKNANFKIFEMPIEWHHKKEGKIIARDVLAMLISLFKMKRYI